MTEHLEYGRKPVPFRPLVGILCQRVGPSKHMAIIVDVVQRQEPVLGLSAAGTQALVHLGDPRMSLFNK